jgi:ferredoxin-NADP reductase
VCRASCWVTDRLAVGDRVSLSGPYGTFIADPAQTDPCVYLAGGSGLAPTRALVEAALAADPRRRLTVVFSARTEADVLDREWHDGRWPKSTSAASKHRRMRAHGTRLAAWRRA